MAESKIETVLTFIAESPWFSRVWTVQEFALAQQAELLIGSVRCDLRAILSYWPQLLEDLPTFSQLGSLAWVTSMYHRQHIRFMVHPFERNADALEQFDIRIHSPYMIIQSVSTCDARDPRDKVFGVHSLISALGGTPSHPDYSKPIAEVYQDCVLSAIEKTKKLEIFAEFLPSDDHSLELPSWVPNFNAAVEFGYKSPHMGDKYPGLAGPWRASNDEFRESKPKLSTDGRLDIMIKSLGKLTNIGQPWNISSSQNEREVFSSWLKLNSEKLIEPDIWTETLKKIVIDHDFGMPTIPPLKRRGYYHYRIPTDPTPVILPSAIIGDIWNKAVSKFKLQPKSKDEEEIEVVYTIDDHIAWANDELSPERVKGVALNLVTNLEPYLGKRLFIITTPSGGYEVGIAHQTIEKDDIAVIASGADLPLILRQHGDDYKFICPALIVSEYIMRGEAWRTGQFEFTNLV